MSVLTEEEKLVFEYTQGHRKKLIDLMTEHGQYPINDPEKIGQLLKALSEMDKNQLNVTKLRVQAKKDEDDKHDSAMLVALLKNIGYDDRKELSEDVRTIPSLPENIEINESITPEELELPKPMGSAEESYDAQDDEEEP